MIALRNYFPHGCAGPNGCDDGTCTMCNGASSMGGEIEIARTVEAGNPARDGDPTLSAERKRGPLAFRKRTRSGANYVPRHARV